MGAAAVYVEHGGKRWRKSELAKHLGIAPSTLDKRLEKGHPLDQRQRIQRKRTGYERSPTGQKATEHELYKVWCDMRNRCFNEKSVSWQWYGALGIRVCERWHESFWAFVEDMGPRPPGTSLDRINSKGNYEPSNCRWATWSQQHRNKRTARLVVWEGETMNTAALAERLGLSFHEVWSRVRHYNGDMVKVKASLEKLLARKGRPVG